METEIINLDHVSCYKGGDEMKTQLIGLTDLFFLNCTENLGTSSTDAGCQALN